jgi:hypothetical protein
MRLTRTKSPACRNLIAHRVGSSAGLVNPLACRQRWILEEGTSKTASFRQEKSHSGNSKADGHPDQA